MRLKVNWKLPLEWKYVRLSKITEVLIERAGNNKYETLSISAGVGFVNQANKFGKELSGKQYEKYIVLHKGDFSYNKGNSKKYPQGCIYQLKDREVAVVPNVFESFYLTQGNNDYFEQLFMSGYLNSQLFAKINHGVRDDGLLNLKGEDFYSCYVPFPPLPEQQKIAEILSTQDKLIELYERKIEQLKTLKKGYLQKMFPKKGSSVPELRFKGFADDWEQRKLGDHSEIVAGGTPNTAHSEYWNPKEIPWMSSGEINNKVIYSTDNMISKIGFSNSSAKWVKEKSVLIALAGQGKTRGTVAITEISLTTNQSIAAIQPDDILYYKYLFQNLEGRYDELRSISSGDGTRGGLNKQILSDLIVLAPTISEQKMIGDFLCNIDNLITLHQRKLYEEKQKKKALMQLLLTGKVRVI